METKEPERCPTCGHIISFRVIKLYSELLRTLHSVWKWVESQGTGYRFTRKEIRHLFSNENDSARFGDLIYFGGLMFKDGKGRYGLNLERCRNFFEGKREIPMKVRKNPETKSVEPFDYRFCNDIPSLKTFLDAQNKFVPTYSSKLKKGMACSNSHDLLR